MNLTGAIIVFAVAWFMVFLCVLTVRFTSQEEAGSVVPGTPRSAPADPDLGRRAKITTVIAVIIWALIFAAVQWSGLGIDDLDVFGIMTGHR
ncbi:MAG: DUF1467 family protein [bacterium]